eukprot:540316_1
MNISNILHNILLFITIFYIPLLCNSTYNNNNNDKSLTLTRLDDIYTLIESGDIKNGKCDDMCLHCNYFSDWGSKNSLTNRYELYCGSNNICILTCNVSNSCLDI